MKVLRQYLVWACLLLTVSAAAAQTHNPTMPPTRAITGFVRLSHDHYVTQIAETLSVLRTAKTEFEKRGYQVQSLRIVTQPLAELVQGQSETEAFAFLIALDQLAAKEGFVVSVGPAMMSDGDDPRSMRLLARALSSLPSVQGAAILADEGGIHWQVVRESAALVRHVADNSPRSQGTLNFAAMAMMKPYGPFFPGTYHTGAGRQFSFAFQSANIVQEVFARTRGEFAGSITELTRQLTAHAKVAESIGQTVAAATGWVFAGIDPSPAPLGDVSIGAAIETYTGATFGSSGTITAALIITTAVKAIPVKQVGYAGLMAPVMEDKLLARRWAEGTFDMDSLLAYSAICGIGLDTVPLPGDISEEQLTRIFGDVAALAWKWNKPLSARLQPVKGKKAGDQTDFNSPYLFNTTLQPLQR